MIVIRYADDTIVGFQHELEAKAFLDDLKERMRAFELALHPDKTRLIRFGRSQFADRRVSQKCDVSAALLQFVECRDAALEQRFAIHRGPDSLPVSIEKLHTKGVLQVCDHLRHGGLRHSKLRGGLGHAAALDDG
jgi:hypothetical protein